VNRVIEALVQRNQPPQRGGQEVRILYGSQVGTAPPTFAIVSNAPDALHESYQRFLINGFRDAWGFTGVPIRLKLRRKRSRR
jgi:GTP-binding protein